MNIVLFLVACLWLIRIVINIFSYASLWFVKEYRPDRMLVHLRTNQGKKILLPPIRRPPVSPKSILLTIGTAAVLVLFYLFIPLNPFLRFFLADILTFPVTFVIVIFLSAPTVMYHQYVIKQAISRLRAHKRMTIVGITGSFGKTSTKDYIASILGKKYRIMKTEASKNSPIGIAEAVVRNLKPNDQIFVVEMGAYKKGEIAGMTRMVLPEIAVLTAINPQHQDLFGSIENTKKAKYELVQGLVGRKLVICNADTAGTAEIGEWAQRDGYTVWWYSSKRIHLSGPLFKISDISYDRVGIRFGLTWERKKINVFAPVIGSHQASNVTAAIAVAIACGMDFGEAVKGAGSITPSPMAVKLAPGVHGSIFIDDTFNNSPDSAIAALDVLASLKGKKILVFQPMIELGRFTENAHEEVGEHAGKICQAIILTNHNFTAAFERGVRKGSKTTPIMILSPRKAAQYIEKEVGSGDGVLFKGKEAGNAERLLLL